MVNLVGSSGKPRNLISTLLNIFILQQFLMSLITFKNPVAAGNLQCQFFIRKFCAFSPEYCLTVSWGGCHDDHCSSPGGISAEFFFFLCWLVLVLYLQALGSVEMIVFTFPALDFTSANRIIAAIILIFLGLLVYSPPCVYHLLS